MTSFDIASASYEERVYAGVLGKIIGVYLGRPFEGWKHQQIMQELGEIDHYVHEQLNQPLVVTDDDIAGTFSFYRALEDSGYDPDLTPAQIGRAWLNYLVEERTILWWGGMGVSTEHTAYFRLKHGIEAPASGSIATNGKTIAEQIGAQIFIDAWAMLHPGDPEAAADWAKRAATVSHDGEALYGAQVVAAIEAEAFVSTDINHLIDTALRFIPADSVINRVIGQVREWHARHDNWYTTRDLIEANFGYDKWPGACHMVPNHALIILALLYGEGDFRKSLMVANTAGWDTDCNSGNVGCILGIRGGLATINETPDYRDPVADRLYLSTAEGGRGISDALIETYRIVNAARALRSMDSVQPKDGAKFHFSLPGSVQGFEAVEGDARVSNPDGDHLKITLGNSGEAVVSTPTFTDESVQRMRGYKLFASPTLYPGQTVRASVRAGSSNVTMTPLLSCYDQNDAIAQIPGEIVTIAAGSTQVLSWTVPDLGGCPIARIGYRISGTPGDSIALNWVTWDGAPTVSFPRLNGTGDAWKRAWVDGAQRWEGRFWGDYFIAQHEGVGLIAQGTNDWNDYTASASIKSPLAGSFGMAARVGGMRRYYALELTGAGTVQLVKCVHDRTVLAEAPFSWNIEQEYAFALTVSGNQLTGSINGEQLLTATDNALSYGSAGFVIESGNLVAGPLSIRPA